MNIALLRYSLERISSLEHYYEAEAKNVLRVAKKGKSQHSVGAMIEDYFMCLANLSEKELSTEEFKKFEKKVLKHIEVASVTEGNNSKSITYRFLSEEQAEKAGNLKEEKRLYYQYAEMPLIHGCSTLMMVVTRFEEFISNYLSELYTRFPHKYLDNQQLSFSEICSADIKEIKKNLVLREVDYKMRESFKEWFKLFTSHGLSCKLFEEDLSVLSEIYARRNIIVHNSGIVNPSYLAAVPDSGQKLGDRLSVNEEYVKTVFDTIYRIIILMIIESSKLNKDNKDEYFAGVFDVLFEYLLRGKYKVCEPAYAELSIKEGVNSEVQLMSKVNRWICIIAEKGLNEVESEIQSFDVSTLNDSFKMAKHVLLKDYDATNIILKRMLKNDESYSSCIEEWPLFMWYRESDQFVQLKEELPNLFGIERKEVSEQELNDSGNIVLPEAELSSSCELD